MVTSRAIARAFIALIVIFLWLSVAGVGGMTAGRLSEVQKRDASAFLPSSAEATKARQWQDRFLNSSAIPALVLVESDEAVTPPELTGLTEALSEVEGVEGSVIGPIPSEDTRAAQYVVPIRNSTTIREDVTKLRQTLANEIPSGMRVWVSGPAGFIADLSTAFAGIDGLLLLVALVAVLIILLVVYRSIFLPVIVLSSAMAALTGAFIAVYWMAANEWITLDGQSQGILSILVIGAATDYALLLVARFRETIAAGKNARESVGVALRRSAEPILASSGTVIAGLLCLLISDLGSNRALGPVAASGIILSVLASLTFLPACLLLLGRFAFWPFIPRAEASPRADEDTQKEKQGLWGKVATFVAARPRPIWLLTTLALALACAGLVQLNAVGVPQSELVLVPTESAQGQEAIGRHFDAGAGSPTVLVVAEDRADEVLDTATAIVGVGGGYIQAEDGGPVRRGAAPAVVDDKVIILLTLDHAPDSAAAEETIQELRAQLDSVDPDALVGGPTATALDTRTTAKSDLVRIIPLILISVLLILILLLRSLVAPVVLVATTLLSFGSALGVSALFFSYVPGLGAADPAVPLFSFVFLVALGVDYNIFLATRVREEAAHLPPREAVSQGLRVTGGVITSAGVVLAATFAALGVIPIVFMVQVGFIVAFGVLLDTIVVRSLLVPAIAHELGRWFWWPSALSRARVDVPSKTVRR